jgi:hypothetical protein
LVHRSRQLFPHRSSPESVQLDDHRKHAHEYKGQFFFWRKKYEGQLNERAVARTGELRHGAPAALPVAEDEADELLVLFRRPRALLQPHLLAARLPPHFFLTKNYCLIKNNEAMAAAQALCSGGARLIPHLPL